MSSNHKIMKKSNFSSYPFLHKTFFLDFWPKDSIQKWNQIHIRDQLTETNRLIYLISIFDKQSWILKFLAFWIWPYLPNTLPRGSKILARGGHSTMLIHNLKSKKEKRKTHRGSFFGVIGGHFWVILKKNYTKMITTLLCI